MKYQMSRKFESIQKAKAERNKRICSLMKSGDPAAHQLADLLKECANNPCGSAACPVCFRQFRVGLYQQTRALAIPKGDWRIVTIVFYEATVSSEKLEPEWLQGLPTRLRSRLRATEITGPVIGGMEFDYHPEIGKWMPHFHLMMPNQDFSTLRSLIKKKCRIEGYGKELRPMKVQPLKLRIKQLTYLLKSYCCRVERYETETGKKRTRKVGLKTDELNLSLLTLHQLGFSSLCFKYGIRKGSPAKSTTSQTL